MEPVVTGASGCVGTAVVADIDAAASSGIAQNPLRWRPAHAGSLEDLRTGEFFSASS